MSGNTQRHIVVTGATGFIGRHLIAQLVHNGDRVTALVRNVDSARVTLPGVQDFYQWDSGSAVDGAWAKAIDGCTAVVHLAGEPVMLDTFNSRWTEQRKAKIRDSRVNGTRLIVNAMAGLAVKPGVFLSGSAVGYYGTSDQEQFTEDSPPGKDFLGTVCSAWEKEALAAEAHGIRTVTLRTGIVLASDGGALPKIMCPAFNVNIFKLGLGGHIGTGKQPFPWIHIDDEISIINWAIDTPDVRGPLNLVSPGLLTNKQFTAVLGTVLSRPTLLPIPIFALWLLLGDASTTLTEGQNVIPDHLTRYGYRFRFHTALAALRDIIK